MANTEHEKPRPKKQRRSGELRENDAAAAERQAPLSLPTQYLTFRSDAVLLQGRGARRTGSARVV